MSVMIIMVFHHSALYYTKMSIGFALIGLSDGMVISFNKKLKWRHYVEILEVSHRFKSSE